MESCKKNCDACACRMESVKLADSVCTQYELGVVFQEFGPEQDRVEMERKRVQDALDRNVPGRFVVLEPLKK